ncbi:unnamed protein product, partial [Protopolystoma xenopodis]
MRASGALKFAAIEINQYPIALQLRYLQALSSITSGKQSTIVFPVPLEMAKFFRNASGPNQDPGSSFLLKASRISKRSSRNIALPSGIKDCKVIKRRRSKENRVEESNEKISDISGGQEDEEETYSLEDANIENTNNLSADYEDRNGEEDDLSEQLLATGISLRSGTRYQARASAASHKRPIRRHKVRHFSAQKKKPVWQPTTKAPPPVVLLNPANSPFITRTNGCRAK